MQQGKIHVAIEDGGVTLYIFPESEMDDIQGAAFSPEMAHELGKRLIHAAKAAAAQNTHTLN